MSLVTQTLALLDILTPADVQALPPAQRRRFADLCRYMADLADRPTPPNAGLLSILGRGERAH